MTDLQSIRTTRKIVRQELLEHFSDQEIEAEHSRRVLRNFPDRPEAGTGFIDRIQVTTFPAEVPASPGVDFLASSSWRALAFSAGGDGGRN